MINPLGDSLSVYDLSTNKFSAKFNGHSIPTHVGHLSCLGSDLDSLYIVGGGHKLSTLGTVQILNLHNGEWSNGPEMIQNRNRHSCIVDKNNGTNSSSIVFKVRQSPKQKHFYFSHFPLFLILIRFKNVFKFQNGSKSEKVRNRNTLIFSEFQRYIGIDWWIWR